MSDFLDRMYDKYHSRQVCGSDLSESALESANPYLDLLIKRHFPKDMAAVGLDLGCGSGALLGRAKRFGFSNFRGVDGSQEQVEVARRRGLDNVTHADLFHYVTAQKDESVDFVVTFDVLEHLEKPDILRLMDHVYRVLKSGGVWLVHVPNGEGIFGAHVFSGDLTHATVFSASSVQQLCRAGRFSGVKVFEDRPVIHGLKSATRALLWLLIRSLYRFLVVVETGGAGANVYSRNVLAVARK